MKSKFVLPSLPLTVVYYLTPFVVYAALAMAIVALVNSNKAVSASGRALANTIIAERLVYFNPIYGNDGNTGGSPNRAVKTFAHALTLFNSGIYLNCTLVVLDNWVITTEEEQTINLFPTTRQCKALTVMGLETNVHLDVVAAVETVSPLTYNWTTTTLQTGGLTSSLYQGYFVENVNQRRYYVVDDNNAINVTSIAGYSFGGIPPLPIPPREVGPEAWIVGDHLRAFTVATQIAWTGVLLIDLPYGTVTFRSLVFMPLTAGSTLRVPDGTDYNVILEACRLGCQSNAADVTSYQGSLSIRGCYAYGVAPDAVFVDSDLDQLALIESAWLDSCTLICTGICNFRFLKSTNAVGDAIVLSGSVFSLYNAYITSVVRIDRASLGQLQKADMYHSVIVDNGADVVLENFLITCDPFGGCIEALYVGAAASVRIRQAVQLVAQVLVHVDAGGQFHMFSLANTLTVLTTTTPFVFEPNSAIWIFPSFPFIVNITLASPAVPIIKCNGCIMVLQGVNTNYVWSTAAGAPLIEVTSNGNVVDGTTGTKLSGQGNQGAVSTAVIKCGSLAIAQWSVSQFDTVQNAICTR